ncbi:MAG TPA: serine/threonine-protein kinase [Longimicrobium sp.]|nr:serine/threonine-protein kinase [Longimicrobium sp.]
MTQPFGRVLEGRTLAGRYALERVIGSGGMSLVFAGRDQVLGRPVAVKVVSLPAEDEAMRENLRERFRREAASAARIPHHPNVVQIFDYGTDAELDLDFIVMELLRGRDLKQALAESAPPPLEEGLRILRQAARGLAAGHRVGIVHRDVKPANVFLVGEDGAHEFVRLLDFGIAKPMEGDDSDSITTIGQLPHSPAYASPEQLEAGTAVSPSSDVYQLGLIGYELLTGDRPFSEAERTRIQGGEELPLAHTPRWSAVPAPIREVIARALRRDPAARYADAADFAEALHAAEDQTVLHAGPAVPIVDATLEAPPRPAPIPVAPVPTPGPAAAPAPAGVPVAAPARTPAKRISPALWLVPLFVIAAALIWALTRGGGEETAAAPLTPPDSTRLGAYDEEFVRLQGQASERLEETASQDSTAPIPPPSPAAGDEESVPERETDERAEAAAVQAAVLDANQAWVEGDLDRHMSHYARRVDYYSEENASHAFVRNDRRVNMRRYDSRQMTIRRQAVTFRPDGRARNLVDKTWVFEGSGERWRGSMRMELILEKRDGNWVIVSEKSADVDYSRKERI